MSRTIFTLAAIVACSAVACHAEEPSQEEIGETTQAFTSSAGATSAVASCPSPVDVNATNAAELDRVWGLLAPRSSSGATRELSDAAASHAIRVAVILLDYSNKPLACDPAEVDDLVFGPSGSLRSAFEQSSSGHATVEGTVFGPFPLSYRDDDYCTSWLSPIPGQVMDSLLHLTAGAQIAFEHGINFYDYDRLVVMVPEKAWWCQTVPIGLPFGFNKGAAILSDSETTTWFGSLHACEHVKLIAHEFGHTSGFDHAEDATGPYGDRSDNMGAPSAWLPTGYAQLPLLQYDAVRKLQMGWWEPGKVAKPSPGTTQTYELQANAASPEPGRPALVKLPIPGAVDGDAYYLSYRAPIGLDSNLEPPYQHKVQVHRSGAPPLPGILFDGTFLHANLAVGQAYVDAAFTAEVLEVTATYASIRVTRP